MQLQDFLDKLHQDGSLYVYPRSAEEAEGTCCAIILAGEEKEKLLAVAGEKADTFAGEEVDGIKLCGLAPHAPNPSAPG